MWQIINCILVGGVAITCVVGLTLFGSVKLANNDKFWDFIASLDKPSPPWLQKIFNGIIWFVKWCFLIYGGIVILILIGGLSYFTGCTVLHSFGLHK